MKGFNAVQKEEKNLNAILLARIPFLEESINERRCSNFSRDSRKFVESSWRRDFWKFVPHGFDDRRILISEPWRISSNVSQRNTPFPRFILFDLLSQPTWETIIGEVGNYRTSTRMSSFPTMSELCSVAWYTESRNNTASSTTLISDFLRPLYILFF